MSAFQYFLNNATQILTYLLEHIQLTGIAVGLSVLIGAPLGILICHVKKLSKPILGISNIIQAILSMALLGFFVSVLGIGVRSAVIAVMLYSLLPIIKNTYTGIQNINAETIESATGIGLTKFQILAGAIPACLLAIAMDYLVGTVEKLVTPVSLQSGNRKSRTRIRKGRRNQKMILATCAVLLIRLFGYNSIQSTKQEGLL